MMPNANIDQLLAELNQGRFKPVLKQARAAMKSRTAPPGFANLAGIALCGLGQHREAVPMFQKALQRDPGFHDARNNLAQTLILLNQTTKALQHLDAVLKAEPANANALYLKAQALWATGALQETAALLDHLLDAGPQPRAYALRALVRGAMGLENEAVTDFEQALALNPNDVETLVNASLPLARQTRSADAQAVISRALVLAPDHPGANLRQAALHLEAGETEAAAAAYRKVLALVPGQPEALEQLAALAGKDEAAALSGQVDKALARPPRVPEDRAQLHFAEARLARLRGDGAGFARSLARANRNMAELLPYDAAADTAATEAIIARFAAGGAPAPAEGPEPRPLFVTGMPRSGTTLAEAVLGAHPQVAPLGERAAAGALLAPVIEAGAPFEAEALAAEYSRRLPALPDGTRAYTDKMPENYRYIGFLIAAFPQARFLYLERDPRDTALSLWQAHFSGRALSYAYSLEAMAHRFNLHARLMRHWRALYPDRILPLAYEDLVADIECESRRIAAFAGLGWVPEMARPQEAAGQVLTLSAGQLRQPVHSRSVGRWADHAEMLAPFTAALDPALWPGIAG